MKNNNDSFMTNSAKQLQIHIEGQLLSEDAVRGLVSDLLVPLLTESLLQHPAVQQMLRSWASSSPFRSADCERRQGLLTVNETAERLGIRPVTVREWLARRKLPMVKVGRCVRVPSEAVAEYIQRNTIPVRAK